MSGKVFLWKEKLCLLSYPEVLEGGPKNHSGQIWYWADVPAKGYVEGWTNMELDLHSRFAGAFWSPHKDTFSAHSLLAGCICAERKKGIVPKSDMSPWRGIMHHEETWVWLVWRDLSVSANSLHWDICPSLSTSRWKIKTDGQGFICKHLLPTALTLEKTFFEMEEMQRRRLESDRETGDKQKELGWKQFSFSYFCLKGAMA